MRPSAHNPPDNQPLPILVAAPAGIQRDALVSLLRAQPNLVVVAVAGDPATVQRIVMEDQVHLIVLDGGLQGDAAMGLVAWLHQARPTLRCIVLADRVAQVLAFQQAGADDALLKGCLDKHLLAVLAG